MFFLIKMKYKNKFNYISFLLIFFIFLLPFFILFDYDSKDELIEYIILIKRDIFLSSFILTLISLLYFLTPLPMTPLVIFNGFVLSNFGFIISYFIVILDSLIIYLISKRFLKKNLTKIRFMKRFNKYQKIFQNNDVNVLFGLRFIIPHFFHGVLCGLTNIKIKNLLLIVILADLPGIYAVNIIGKSLYNLMDFQYTNFQKILFDKNFYIPLIIVLLIYIFQLQFKKKIENK